MGANKVAYMDFTLPPSDRRYSSVAPMGSRSYPGQGYPASLLDPHAERCGATGPTLPPLTSKFIKIEIN